MNGYVFYDEYDGKELDLKDEDYIDLIKRCCESCKTVSFRIKKPDAKTALALEKFQINKPENVRFSFSRIYSNDELGIRYYKVCPALCDLLINSARSIFEWKDGWDYENPENPTFYRDDGSVFLFSVIHEGEVYLFPNEDEDVDDIISKGWIKIDETQKG